jgi:hypothetical protein
MNHSLIIGGTGMLRGVSLYLAERDDVVSVVARSREGLRRLAEEAHKTGSCINAIDIDYGDSIALQTSLNAAVRQYGRIERVIAWIHSSAKEAPSIVARAVGRSRYACRYFELCGSGTVDPTVAADQRRRDIERSANIVYRQVILGFVRETSGPRWLTSEEIVKGVIAAVESDVPCQVIGVVHPWSDRPHA